jgi:hypothetical protein
MVGEYDAVLGETLKAGVMGTEESAMTLVCARRPALCRIVSVSENQVSALPAPPAAAGPARPRPPAAVTLRPRGAALIMLNIS